MSVGNISAKAAAMLGAACWPDLAASCASDISRDSFLGKHTCPLHVARTTSEKVVATGHRHVVSGHETTPQSARCRRSVKY